MPQKIMHCHNSDSPAIDERQVIFDASCEGAGGCSYRATWKGLTTHLICQDGSIKDTFVSRLLRRRTNY